MSWTAIIKTFVVFIQTTIIAGVFALELFGFGDGVYYFVQKPVIILFYIAFVIALLANLFRHIHRSITYTPQHFFYKLIKSIEILLTIGSRVVFQVVVVWTIVNATQYKKQRTVDIGYGLALMNAVVIFLTLVEAFLPIKNLQKQKPKVQ